MAVSKRGDSWIVTVYDPLKQRKRWVGTFPNQKHARRAEAEALLTRRHGDVTVGLYAARWLEMHPRPKKATNLYLTEQLSRYIRSHGDVAMGSISRVDARLWALENRSLIQVVRAMFADAKRDGMIADNPFTELRLQHSRGRRDLDVLSVEEITRLGEVADETYGPSFAAFILTAAYCGLRPGELYALRWPRVDLRNDEIAVAGSYSTRSKETTTPKNNQQRLVVLFPEAKRALLRVPQIDPVVFRTITGRPLDGRSLHYYWNPVRTAVGRPSMSFYELRHFCAAYLLNTLGHEAEDVAYQLGHTDGGVLVRKLYGHPSEELARQRLKAGLGRKVTPIHLVSGATMEQNTA